MTARCGNVLHVVDSLGFGGAQTILKGYFESLIVDPDVYLYAMRTTPRPVEIAHPNVTTSRSSLRFSITPLFDLRTLVRSRAIGVLHCHLFRAQVFGFLLKSLFFPRITLIFHEHGRAVGREGESRLETLVFRWFLRRAWRRVDHFVCISDHTRASLLRVIPGADRNATVLANPIQIHPCAAGAWDRESIRREHSIPEGAFVVGFASRLVGRKGWSDFLDAVALLVPEFPAFYLVAGDGEDRNKAEAHIRKLGLEGRGQMLGHIDWMGHFYRCLDCFVMPSHWEPHGLSHLEAQAFGVPVVVSSVPGLASTVREDHDALLFSAGDAQALADCIRRLATDSALRDRMIEGGRANSARYTMTAFAAGLGDIYAAACVPRSESVGGG
jgi:glycosyltransferase involved in cell wall biosynthesis